MQLLLQQESEISLPHMENFAIVLCGGGGAGRWQAGVLAALAQQGVIERARVISGTSVGGINTGIFGLYGLTQGATSSLNPCPTPRWHQAVDVWESITKNSDGYKGDLTSLPGQIGSGVGLLAGSDCLLNPDPLHQKIDNIFGSLDMEAVSEISGVHLMISAMDLNSQLEEFYTSFGPDRSMKISEAIKRTSALPVVFKSQPGKDSAHPNAVHWHVDGGLAANNPFLALNTYNRNFPGAQVKKVIIVYCYPDITTDIGISTSTANDNTEYRMARDVALRSLGAVMNGQEQMAESVIIDKVKEAGWDVLALYPKNAPCDAINFSKTILLQEGYDYAVAGKGYSYRDDATINIIDFLKRT